MASRTADGITILEGLEVVRHRPSMYIGSEEPDHSLRSRLLELVVDGAAHDSPPPREVKIVLWREGALTVAFDGAPLPIEPSGPPDDPIRHPALERLFMHLNALCERLVVSTVHGGERYRAVFSKGALVTLLARIPCERPLGTSWLTFLPDTGIITGAPLTVAQAAKVADRVAHLRSLPARDGWLSRRCHAEPFHRRNRPIPRPSKPDVVSSNLTGRARFPRRSQIQSFVRAQVHRAARRWKVLEHRAHGPWAAPPDGGSALSPRSSRTSSSGARG
jgi:hypothetical protein